MKRGKRAPNDHCVDWYLSDKQSRKKKIISYQIQILRGILQNYGDSIVSEESTAKWCELFAKAIRSRLRWSAGGARSRRGSHARVMSGIVHGIAQYMTEFDILRPSGRETVLPGSRRLLNPCPNETWLIPGSARPMSCILQISEFHPEFLQKASVYIRARRCEGCFV